MRKIVLLALLKKEDTIPSRYRNKGKDCDCKQAVRGGFAMNDKCIRCYGFIDGHSNIAKRIQV